MSREAEGVWWNRRWKEPGRSQVNEPRWRPEAESQDPLGQALMEVAALEAQRHCMAIPEMVKGCEPPAEAGLEGKV